MNNEKRIYDAPFATVIYVDDIVLSSLDDDMLGWETHGAPRLDGTLTKSSYQLD